MSALILSACFPILNSNMTLFWFDLLNTNLNFHLISFGLDSAIKEKLTIKATYPNNWIS